MQKTKLGISVGLLGAAIYFAGLFGGYIPLLLLAGYALFCEENEWLKKSAVKACVIVFSFALLSALINFIPDTISLINSTVNIFDGTFSVGFISKILSFVRNVLDFAEKFVLIILGIAAIRQGNVAIGSIDKMVDKHME